MSDPSAATSNEASNAKQRHWAAWVLDIFVAIGALSQIAIGILLIYELKEYQASNQLTRKSLEISARNLDLTAKSVDLTAKSVELTQRGTELSQKSIELTQKGLEATQEALKYASKSNELSAKGIEAANTPWLDVAITNVTVNGKDGLFIDYTLQNHSDSPATGISSQCYLEHAGVSYIDENSFSSNNLAIMPHQPVAARSTLIARGHDPKITLKQIAESRVNIKINVIIVSPSGKKTTLIETFRKKGRVFSIIDMQFNPPWADVVKNDTRVDESSA